MDFFFLIFQRSLGLCHTARERLSVDCYPIEGGADGARGTLTRQCNSRRIRRKSHKVRGTRDLDDSGGGVWFD